MHPGRCRDPRLQARRVSRSREGRRGCAERDRDPPRLARPFAVRDRDLGSHGRAPRARRTGAGPGVRQRVDHRQPVHRPAGRGAQVGSTPAVVPEVSGRAWITGMSPVPARSDRPVPDGVRSCRGRRGETRDRDRGRRGRPVRRRGAQRARLRGDRGRGATAAARRVGGKRRLDHPVARRRPCPGPG